MTGLQSIPHPQPRTTDRRALRADHARGPVRRVKWSCGCLFGHQLQGRARGHRRGQDPAAYPLVGGIDLAGVVESSTRSALQGGDRVLVTGCGLSRDARRRLCRVRARARATGSFRCRRASTSFKAMATGHRGLHRRARHPSHGTQRPEAGQAARRRHRRHRRRRQYRHQHARARAATRSSRSAASRAAGLSESARRHRDPAAQGDRLRLRPLEPRSWQAPSTMWAARCSPGSRAPWTLGQHRQHRPRRRRRAQDHRHALHPAGREPARHQFLGDTRASCASRSGSASRRT